jgi:Immunity protein 27
MMDIKPSETVLTGQCILQGGRPVADDVCKRILTLAKSYLVELGRDASGWNALYRDPNDGRYWELIYPQSELHGGGPPQLRCLTAEEARQKYGAQVVKS